MGRHSAGPDPDAPPTSGSEPVSEPASDHPQHEGAPHRLLDRLALAAAAAAGTGAVMAWAGAQPLTYLLGAAGTVVAVLVAAQVAGSVPGPARSRTDAADRAVGREP